MTTQLHQQRTLGGSGLSVPALGVGTNRWGASRNRKSTAAFQVFQACLDSGQAFFDTAEIYTGGNAERTLGDCMRRDTRPAIIATKFAPLPTRLSPHALMDALDASLNRLGVESIDLYYIHWPFTLLRVDALMDMMALAVRLGKIRAVGVSNYNARQMRQAAARLARYNIPLAANEVHYSLLHRQPETNGVLETCRELNVALVAYQPLESGRLQEQPGDQEAGTRAAERERAEPEAHPSRRQHAQEELARLRLALSTIAHVHNRTVSQVALNWLLQRDEHVIPIPGTTSVSHLHENVSTLEWSLSNEEFEEISKLSTPWKK